MSLFKLKRSKWLVYGIIILLSFLLLIYPFEASARPLKIAYEAPGQVQSQPQQMTSRFNQQQDRARDEQRSLSPATGLNATSHYYRMLRNQRDSDEAQKDLSDAQKRENWKQTQDEMNQLQLNNPKYRNHFEVNIPPRRHYQQSRAYEESDE